MYALVLPLLVRPIEGPKASPLSVDRFVVLGRLSQLCPLSVERVKKVWLPGVPALAILVAADIARNKRSLSSTWMSGARCAPNTGGTCAAADCITLPGPR